MDIFKRPIFYAALICCVASVLFLYAINPFLLLITSILLIVFLSVKYQKLKYLTIAVIILAFSINLFSESKKIEQINMLDNQSIKGEFLVISEPVVYDKFNKTSLKIISSDKLSADIKFMAFDSEKTDFSTGDIISATLKISVIKNNDQYRFYDYGNGIYATANITKFEKIVDENKLYKTFDSIRKFVKFKICDILNGDVAGLLLAITTGEKSLISDNLLSGVKESGISHVIAVSGLHLSIILTALFLVIDRLFYNKYIRTVLSLMTVFIICGICGFTMSVVRAATMFLVGAFAPIFKRDKDLLSMLLTAFTGVLIASPFAVANVSFLLSVLSTLSIVWVVPFYSNLFIKKFKVNSKIIKALIDMIFISIFTMLFTLPVVINIFGYISIISPITNILVTYPVIFALIFSCIGLLLSTIPIIGVLGNLIIKIAGIFSDIIIHIVNTITKLPVTIAILPKLAIVLSISIIFILIFYMYFYKYKSKIN
ncbi:MAG: ComEC/Rec2 family competence protein [Clostridia bacterium]|nr:ComEC/Rec2 family competence protein [Clostridia bacterium]